MNSKKILSFVLLAITFMLGSCKDDDDNKSTPAPAEEFTFANTTISLKNANFYRISNSVCCNNHSIRAYVITDGVYSNVPGWGWEAEDYTGETYFLIVTLLEPDAGEHGAGEYTMYPWWSEEPYTHERMSYVDLFTTEDENEIEYLTGDDLDTSPVVVEGGMNIGDEMTVSFEGLLLQRVNEELKEYEVAKFWFKGAVRDVE
jgi:hypothetical protein